MGEHTGPITVYRVPRRRWHEVLLGSGNRLGLYVVTLIGLLTARLLLAVSLAAAAAVGAVIATLWLAVWIARRTTERVQITDRYRWDRAERAGTAVVEHLPVTGLLPAVEVRAVVRRELSQILDLLVEQDRLLAVQRDARRAARDLPAGEPVRRELDAELIALDEQLCALISLVEARVARLAGLAAQATELATLEARRRRARQATTRIRHELRRPEALTGGHQPTDPAGEAVERAEAILTAYREMTQPDPG
ncbi:hypothetical protein [Actinoplanes sp. NPDC026623]|uniref:hypothetical protein n=1 Tax=Actinoplanes sp. NPDC026623 TaxID=3155610 RepID=UPI0033C76B8F